MAPTLMAFVPRLLLRPCQPSMQRPLIPARRAMECKCLALLLLSFLVCWSWQSRAVDDEPLFRYNGKQYTIHDLPLRLRKIYQDLEQHQHEARSKLLKDMLFDVHLHEQQTATGRKRSEIARELLKTKSSSPADIEAHFEANRDRFNGSLEAHREEVEADLRRQQLVDKRIEISNELHDQGRFEVLITRPAPAPIDIPLEGYAARRDLKRTRADAGSGAQMNNDQAPAPIQVVEFGDYQCPRCRDAGAIISRLMKQYPNALEWYYLDFPVNRTGISTIVAYGGICAQQQGRFWEYHDAAFRRQTTLTNESPMQIAAELEFDLGEFNSCLRSTGTIQKVAKSKQIGRQLGVKTTPGLFVNGRPFQTDALYHALESLIAIQGHHRQRREVERLDRERRALNQ